MRLRKITFSSQIGHADVLAFRHFRLYPIYTQRLQGATTHENRVQNYNDRHAEHRQSFRYGKETILFHAVGSNNRLLQERVRRKE